jgi:hypothetical protein
VHTVQWGLVHTSYSCIGLRVLVLWEELGNGQRNEKDSVLITTQLQKHLSGVEKAMAELSL